MIAANLNFKSKQKTKKTKNKKQNKTKNHNYCYSRGSSKENHARLALNWFTGFRGKILTFPIGSYIKTMRIDAYHLEFLIGTK